MKKPLGIILYHGPSLLDGNQIIAIATGLTFKKNVEKANVKVGNMIKVWIMRPDINPILAAKRPESYSYCGDCKHRHFGSCYVNLAHGPHHVFDAYHRRRYVYYDDSMLELFRDRYIRLGSFGEPSAVPIEVWDTICSVSSGFTGYTHNWKNCDPELKNYCMASVDSEKEFLLAQDMGWRTFRIRLPEEGTIENEFICPASKEGGKRSSCEKCGACSGLSRGLLKNPIINIHGANFKVQRFIKGMKKIQNKKKWKQDCLV